jgi:hypothetical protein
MVEFDLRTAQRLQITKRVDPGLRLVKRMLRVSSGKSKFKVHMDTIKNLFTHGNGFAETQQPNVSATRLLR